MQLRDEAKELLQGVDSPASLRETKRKPARWSILRTTHVLRRRGFDLQQDFFRLVMFKPATPECKPPQAGCNQKFAVCSNKMCQQAVALPQGAACTVKKLTLPTDSGAGIGGYMDRTYCLQHDSARLLATQCLPQNLPATHAATFLKQP